MWRKNPPCVWVILKLVLHPRLNFLAVYRFMNNQPISQLFQTISKSVAFSSPKSFLFNFITAKIRVAQFQKWAYPFSSSNLYMTFSFLSNFILSLWYKSSVYLFLFIQSNFGLGLHIFNFSLEPNITLMCSQSYFLSVRKGVGGKEGGRERDRGRETGGICQRYVHTLVWSLGSLTTGCKTTGETTS